MARLIRTEKEVEGRYTEQWIVVEEDVLEQWPAGPRAIVGRPARRLDGHERARGQVTYTADFSPPGMLHAAVLRSPYARARVKKLDLTRARETPWVRGAIGPEDCHVLEQEPSFQGAAVAAVAAESAERAREALALIDVEWEVLEPLLDPEEAVRQEAFTDEPRHYERGDVGRALAEADVVVEGEYRTQTVLHNAMETHQSVCRWEGDTLEVYISTQYIWGIRDDVSKALSLPRDKVRVVCNFMGGGFGAKNDPGDYTFIATAATRAHRPCLRADAPRGEPVSQPQRTIQRLTMGAKSDGTPTASAATSSTPSAGALMSPTEGLDAALYAPEREDDDGRKINSRR